MNIKSCEIKSKTIVKEAHSDFDKALNDWFSINLYEVVQITFTADDGVLIANIIYKK